MKLKNNMRRSKGITILGRLEVIIGVIGTLVLLVVFFGSFALLFFGQGENRMGFMTLFITPLLLPFPILAIAGLGILKIKPWALVLQNIFWALVFSATGLALYSLITQHSFLMLRDTNLNLASIILSIILISTSLGILAFINSSSIRKQFRQ